MKKSVDARTTADSKGIAGFACPGRPKGRRTGTKPGKHSIPQPWRDLDNGCLEFALKELPDESLDEQFVNCAARRARFHERRGDYKIIKLSGTADRAASTANARTASEAAGKSN